MRKTQSEIDKQIEALENEKTELPEFNYFGDNNYHRIETQIAVLLDDLSSDDLDSDDENYIHALEAEDWLAGQIDDLA